MGRGILTGLVWGSVVGFGIVTVANQVVDHVALSPASQTPASQVAPSQVLSPQSPSNLTSEPSSHASNAPEFNAPDTLQPASDADTRMESDPADTDLVNTDVIGTARADTSDESSYTDEMSREHHATSSAQPVTVEVYGDSSNATATAETDAGATADAGTDTGVQSDELELDVPTETAAGVSADTQDPEGDVISHHAPDASDTAPAMPEAPDASVLTPGTQVAQETPVLGSLQSAELPQPDSAASLLTPIDTSLPGQKPIAVGTGALDQDADPASPDLLDPAVKSDVVDVQTDQIEATPTTLPSAQADLGTKVGSFTDRNDDLISSRLPSVGTGPALNGAEDAPVVDIADLPAVVAHASDYTKIGSAPNMSVILVDIGEIDPDASLLANLPFPVTLAVDALTPGASGRAEAYRASGLEVLSLIGLGENSTPQDVAVTINRARDLVPSSIGFLDIPSSSFQTNREIAAQVVATAQATGHGLVSFTSGLNAMLQEATRSDVPAALVFRDFDGRGQDIAAMKRFLDQAAFRAGIDEDIVMLGRAQSETIKGLAEWALGNRAASIEMVPLSLILQEQMAQ